MVAFRWWGAWAVIGALGNWAGAQSYNPNVKVFEAIDSTYPYDADLELVDVVVDHSNQRFVLLAGRHDTGSTAGVGILVMDSSLVIRQRYFIPIPDPYQNGHGARAVEVDSAGHLFVGGDVRVVNRRREAFLLKSHLLPNINYMRLYGIPDTQYVGYDGTGIITALRTIPGQSADRLFAGGIFYHHTSYGTPQVNHRAFVAEVDPVDGSFKWMVANTSLKAAAVNILPQTGGRITVWHQLYQQNQEYPVVASLADTGLPLTAPLRVGVNASDYSVGGEVHPLRWSFRYVVAGSLTNTSPSQSRRGIWLWAVSENFSQVYYSRYITIDAPQTTALDDYLPVAFAVVDTMGYVWAKPSSGYAPYALIRFGLASGNIHWVRGMSLGAPAHGISHRMAVLNNRLYVFASSNGGELRVAKIGLDGSFGDDCRDRIEVAWQVTDTLQPTFHNYPWNYTSAFTFGTGVPSIQPMEWIDSAFLPAPPSVADISFNPPLDSGCENASLTISHSNPNYYWEFCRAGGTCVGGSGISSRTHYFPGQRKVDTLYFYVFDRSDRNRSFCIDSTVVYLTSIPKYLSPGFTYTTNGLTVNLTDTTYGASIWIWDMGNGDTVRGTPNPSYTYSQPGAYTVCLWAGNRCTSPTWFACDTVVVSAAGWAGPSGPNPLRMTSVGWQADYPVDWMAVYSVDGRLQSRCTYCRKMETLHLPSGHYILKVGDGEKFWAIPFWKR